MAAAVTSVLSDIKAVAAAVSPPAVMAMAAVTSDIKTVAAAAAAAAPAAALSLERGVLSV